jgi:nucleoside-diphosphate-sugar epimerase
MGWTQGFAGNLNGGVAASYLVRAIPATFLIGPDGRVLARNLRGPALKEAVGKGRFSWIGGGGHKTSTTHVDNVVEGLVLAATRGKPGNAYFVTDGEPVVFREFITELMATAGVEMPDRSAPVAVARPLAAVAEGIWGILRRTSTPPLTRLAVWLSAMECTIDISKARRELGYEPVKTIEEGLAELRAA